MTETPGWAAPGAPEQPEHAQVPPPPGPGPGPTPQGGPQWGPPGGPQWGWNRPWVPKPGVIPLRPLGVGEILDGAVSTMRAYWRTVLGVSVVVAVLTETVVQLTTWWMQRGLGDTAQSLQDGSAITWHQIGQLYSHLLSGLAIDQVILLLGTLVATALLTMVVSRAVLGQPVTLRDAWADARPRLPRLLGLTLLTTLIGVAVIVVAALPGIIAAAAGASGAAVAGLLVVPLLVGTLVDLWLMISLSLATPALMLEKQGIRSALARSLKLVRGSWWRVFGITLLAGVVVTIVAGLIATPFSFAAVLLSGSSGSGGLFTSSTATYSAAGLAVVGVGAAIGSTLTMPISAAVRVLLYIDLRIRREALDIELARAAGLPDYGGAGAHPADAPPAPSPSVPSTPSPSPSSTPSSEV